MPSSGSSSPPVDQPRATSSTTDAVRADSGLATSYRTRVMLDVLASRILEERELVASSSSDLELDVADPRPSAVSGADRLHGDSRPTSAMSLESVARAQQALHKPIPFVRGGACVEFTRDDLSRLRDAETLLFLQTNSRSFTQGTRPQRVGSALPQAATAPALEKEPAVEHTVDNAPPDAVGAATATKAELEAEIEALQREIETFITAVDDDGHTYQIQLHEHGVLQVPVDVDKELAALEDDDEGDENADVDDSELISSVGTDDEAGADVSVPMTNVQTQPTTEASSTLTTAPVSSKRARMGKGKMQVDTLTRTPSPPPPVTHPPKAPVPSSVATHKGLSSRTKAKQLVTRRPPSIKVRTARQLSAEEEQRITALLDGTTDLFAENPYAPAAPTMLRMAHIDNALCGFRLARAAADRPHSLDTTAVAGEKANHTSVDYLTQAKEVGKTDRRMNALNRRLLRLEREMEELALHRETLDVPPELLAQRPVWARGSGVLPDEASEPGIPSLLADDATVEQMLVQAAEEQQRATAAGVSSQPFVSAVDPFVRLRAEAGAVAARAAEVLAQLDSAPLEMTEEVDIQAEDSDRDVEAAADAHWDSADGTDQNADSGGNL